MKWKYIFFIFFVLMIAGFFYFKIDNKKQKTSPVNNKTFVKKLIVTEKSWQDEIQAVGNIVASKSILISSEVAGIIKKIYFDSGVKANQGQLLLELQSDAINASLEKEKAIYEDDLKNYKRKKKLWASHYISMADIDHAKSIVAKDKFEIKQQAFFLSQHKLIAPFSGWLGIWKVQVGQYITPGQPLINIEMPDPVYVDFSIPEKNLKDIKIANVVKIQSDAYPNQMFFGTILATSNTININNRSFLVRAVIKNKNMKLISGLAVVVSIKKPPQNRIILPQSVLSYSPNGVGVYVIDNRQIARWRPILTGKRCNDEVVILSGLKIGETVVLEGQHKLHDGMMLS